MSGKNWSLWKPILFSIITPTGTWILISLARKHTEKWVSSRIFPWWRSGWLRWKCRRRPIVRKRLIDLIGLVAISNTIMIRIWLTMWYKNTTTWWWNTVWYVWEALWVAARHQSALANDWTERERDYLNLSSRLSALLPAHPARPPAHLSTRLLACYL